MIYLELLIKCNNSLSKIVQLIAIIGDAIKCNMIVTTASNARSIWT